MSNYNAVATSGTAYRSSSESRVSSGLSTQPRAPTAPAHVATTAPLGAASRCGPTARVCARFPRCRRRWQRTSPSGPPAACRPHRSGWTAPRSATVTPKPDTRTRPTPKGCAGCCADSPAGRHARAGPRDRPPPSRRRGWPRSVRLPISGAWDRAGRHGPPPRPGGYRARVGHAGRTASALRSCRAHLGRHGVSERRVRPRHRPPLQEQQDGTGVTLYVGRAGGAAVRAIHRPDASPKARVFSLRSGRAVSNRIAAAAKAAGLIGRPFLGTLAPDRDGL